MKKAIEFLIKQKVFVNMTIGLVILLGLITISGMKREGFPQVSFDMVSIQTIYPGASPEDVEKLVTIPVEKKLREVDGIDKVRSYNIENVSVVVIYLDMRALNKEEIVQDIKDSVESVSGLPDNVQKPVVKEITLDKTQVLNVAVYGKNDDVTYKEIRSTAEMLEDYIYELGSVAEVEDFGLLDREYLVEIDAEKLIRNRIGINAVINSIQKRNIDLPGGELRINGEEFLLKTKDQYRDLKDIENTVINANDLGYTTKLKDLTKFNVKDTFVEPSNYERVNKNNAIILTVKKKASADEIRTAGEIYEKLKTFPYDKSRIEIYPFDDQSISTSDQIKSVITNAITGFILLAAILYFLLGGRMATVVMIGFPISFMLGFLGMKMFGITINVISLFGMIMVLGMIVDFGIVVTENTHRYLELGYKKKDAIMEGVSEVMLPLIITFLCLTAAFMPLAVLTGLVGKFVKAIPIVIITCLGASLITALFIMPTHLGMIAKETVKKKTKKEISKAEQSYEKGFFGKIQMGYKKLLQISIRLRYLTLAILIVMLIGSLLLVKFKIVPFQFIPGGGSQNLTIKTYLPQGTTLDVNLKEVKKLEQIIFNSIRENELEALRVRVGNEDFGIIDPQPGQGNHKSTYQISLVPEKERSRIADKIVAELRHNIEEAQKSGLLNNKMIIKTEIQENGPPVGKPVNIEIRGEDFNVMQKIALEYINYLKEVKGVYDAKTDTEPGKIEYRYSIDEEIAVRTGVSSTDAAYTLNTSYKGAVAAKVQQGKDEIGIRVRFSEKDRKDLRSIDKVMVMNSRGALIPLNRITSVEKDQGTAFINRLNYKRLIQVQAEVDTKVITSRDVNMMLQEKFSDIENRYPGYSIAYGGEQEETNKSMADLGILFIIAIIVIFVILAVYFESLMLPIVIMSAIPFSLVGIILAVFAHGKPLSFMSTLAFFSLSGVIVSNTLVLVQFIRNLIAKGMPFKEALVEGGVLRLRPVILTSGTTVLGLFPTIYGLGGTNYFVAPLALAFGYGLIFATFITLILIPTFYHISEDTKSITIRFLKFTAARFIYRLTPKR
ncbi:MAG: efflux RND transporter permease subunit [Spirochaetes bacterium]|nr:efflux RND transporter permease subunit [Spirochaetota bacterium]